MLVGTITKTDNGSFQVQCPNGCNSTILPLDLEQWDMVNLNKLVGKQVYIQEIMKGGCYVASIVPPYMNYSDSHSFMSKEDAEEFARQAFYEGREISRMEGNIPIYKHQTFNGWLRIKAKEHTTHLGDPKGNSKV